MSISFFVNDAKLFCARGVSNSESRYLLMCFKSGLGIEALI